MKTKKLRHLFVIIIIAFFSVFCFINANFKAYGMYYAAQYYGKEQTYYMLQESLKDGYIHSREKMSEKDIFEIRDADKGSKIIFFGPNNVISVDNDDDSSRIMVAISGENNMIEINNTPLEPHDFLYILKDNNDLKLYYEGVESEANRENIEKNDKKIFNYYAQIYIDKQLESIGKPIINLQWIYNLVQMI